MKRPGRARAFSSLPPAPPGDFEVPGVTLLAFARQTLGYSLGPHCRIRRIVHQHLLAELHQSSAVQVEYDIIDFQGSQREISCRFLDQYGALLAEARVEVAFLS